MRPRRPISPAWLPAVIVVVLAAVTRPPPEGGAVAPPETTTSPTTVGAAPTATTVTSTITPPARGTTASRPPATLPTTVPVPVTGVVALVESVTDGDTIRVRLDGGAAEPLRLIGINAPEQGECYAAEATAWLQAAVAGRDVVLVQDASDRDRFDRLLRYVWVEDRFVNEDLVAGGYAIARRFEPDVGYAEVLEGAQAAAMAAGAGIWAADACGPATGTAFTVDVNYDAPGDDGRNLNGEWATIRNDGALPVDLTGWVLKDESATHRFAFPAGFVLLAGESVTIYSGCGPATSTELYWCTVGSAIWNNDGDTAFLLDPSGNVAALLSYGAAGTAPQGTSASPTTIASSGDDCDPSYPGVCIASPPPDLDCGDIPHRRFVVAGSDPHRFDGDNDGVGCES